jgi:5-methylcytosine-specific restriction endonuclease McrA
LDSIRKIEYHEYLKSSEWKLKRNQVIERDGGKCCLCGCKTRLIVHHLKYPKVIGQETLDMLQCLCKWCHAKIHDKEIPAPMGMTKKQRRKWDRKEKKRIKKLDRKKIRDQTEMKLTEKNAHYQEWAVKFDSICDGRKRIL